MTKGTPTTYDTTGLPKNVCQNDISKWTGRPKKARQNDISLEGKKRKRKKLDQSNVHTRDPTMNKPQELFTLTHPFQLYHLDITVPGLRNEKHQYHDQQRSANSSSFNSSLTSHCATPGVSTESTSRSLPSIVYREERSVSSPTARPVNDCAGGAARLASPSPTPSHPHHPRQCDPARRLR